MPYASNHELPMAVRDHLPAHAQDIFREAFNAALDEYGDHPDHMRRQQLAFQVAWAAVQRKYRKDGERWVAKH